MQNINATLFDTVIDSMVNILEARDGALYDYLINGGPERASVWYALNDLVKEYAEELLLTPDALGVAVYVPNMIINYEAVRNQQKG